MQERGPLGLLVRPRQPQIEDLEWLHQALAVRVGGHGNDTFEIRPDGDGWVARVQFHGGPGLEFRYGYRPDPVDPDQKRAAGLKKCSEACGLSCGRTHGRDSA